MKFLSIWIVLCMCAKVSQAQGVDNVKFFQTDDDQVVILYDLKPIGDFFNVSLSLSEDGGRTFPIKPRTIKGDVGRNVKGGIEKRIIWDALVDVPLLTGEGFVFRVGAEPLKTTSGLLTTVPEHTRPSWSSYDEPELGNYLDLFSVGPLNSNGNLDWYTTFVKAGLYSGRVGVESTFLEMHKKTHFIVLSGLPIGVFLNLKKHRLFLLNFSVKAYLLNSYSFIQEGGEEETKFIEVDDGGNFLPMYDIGFEWRGFFHSAVIGYRFLSMQTKENLVGLSQYGDISLGGPFIRFQIGVTVLREGAWKSF